MRFFLQADGPLKPGAILASNYDTQAQAAPIKKKRENKPSVKGQNGERPKVPKKTLPRKPKASKAEKIKSKSKKGKECQVRHVLILNSLLLNNLV